MTLREGFYSVAFRGNASWGIGLLAFETGKIIGVDIGGCCYDGDYTFNITNSKIDCHIKITVPPGISLVQGVSPKNDQWSFEFDVSFPSALTT